MSKLEAARDPVKKAALEGKLNKLLANMQASANSTAAASAAAAEAAAKRKPPAFQFKPTASSSQSPGIQSVPLTVAEQRRRQQRHNRSVGFPPPYSLAPPRACKLRLPPPSPGLLKYPKPYAGSALTKGRQLRQQRPLAASSCGPPSWAHAPAWRRST